MHTVFVTAQSGPIIQRLLFGRFYSLAKERKDLRLVVFVEPDYFDVCQKLFAHERCIVESVPANKTRLAKVLLRFLSKASIPTETLKLRQKLLYLNGKSFLKFSIMRICWLFGHFRLWRAMLRAAERHLFYDDYFWAPYFKKYEPDAVLASALLSERDTLLIKHARRRGIPSIGIPRGWDNFSSKLFLRAIPDILLAFNNVIPDEAHAYADVPQDRVRLIGFPQFDHYADTSWHMSKEEVAKRLGADPKKRWVSYFTSGGFLTGIVGKDHGDHMEMVRCAIARGELPSDICVVASVYPGYNVTFRKELRDVPTLRFDKDFYLSPNEWKIFMNFIRHSDVVLNFGSTVSLESAILDRPNITLGFNGKSNMGVPWQNKLSTTLDHVIHYRQLQDTGGVWRVNDEKELIRAVGAYLENASLHQEGRRRLREEMVEPLDGRAGERVLEALLSVLKSKEEDVLAPELKTYFIGGEKKAALRTFVGSDFLNLAREREDIRLVMFVSPELVESYRKSFAHARCIVEKAPDIRQSGGALKKFFRIMAVASVPTKTLRLVAKYDYLNGGSFFAFILKRFFGILGHLKVWRAFLRFIEFYLFHDDRIWAENFRRWRPEAVYVPSAITEPDLLLLKYAKRTGVRTVATLNGWDNLTAKGSLRVHPDVLLLQNPSMVHDATRLNDMPAQKLRVVGFPWFDHYRDPSWLMTKEEVAKKIGVDPSRPWIGYFTGGAFVMKVLRARDYGDHVRMLKSALQAGRFGKAELIASVHPGHEAEFGKDVGSIPILRFDDSYYFSREGMKLLMNFIRFCDVTINFGSTVSIEAAIFDKPIIMLGFNGYEEGKLPWQRKLSVIFDRVVHYGELQKSGGVWRVRTEEELIEAVNSYLSRPELHREGRAKLVRDLVGPVGSAGRSLFEALAGGRFAERAKTFFVVTSSGQEIRNFLLGDFYALARSDPSVRLVVFVSPAKYEKCRREFSHDRCIILQPPRARYLKLKKLFRIASLGCIPTKTVRSRIWFNYLQGGSLPGFLVKHVLWLLGNLRAWRAFMRWFELYIFRDDEAWRDHFEKYKPDVVFGAGVPTDECLTAIKYAKRHGIPNVGMVLSWDNLTSKGFLRVHPDILLVQNPTMAKEAEWINSFSRSRVRVVGFPQFDHYIDPSWRMSKKEVAKDIGADPEKPWIVYFAGGLMTGLLNVPDKGDHVLTLNRAMERGEIPQASLIIGVHPTHAHTLREEVEGNPTVRLGKGWNYTLHDMKLLANLLRLSDVTINLGATLSLEAAVFNKPTVLVGFNGSDETNVPWHQSQRAALDNTLHYNNVEDTGGVWRVSNEQELITAVKTYLENPLLHEDGRRRLMRELVGPVDGRAGERVYRAVLSMVK